MFDVFRAAKATLASKVTNVKVCGATLSMLGMPEEYTPEGYAILAKEQGVNIKVKLPKVKNDEGLQSQTAGTLRPEQAEAWCLREESIYAEETPKETARQRKARLASEALAAELKERDANHAAHIGNGQPV